jgi:hypothetical protein
MGTLDSSRLDDVKTRFHEGLRRRGLVVLLCHHAQDGDTKSFTWMVQLLV